VVIVDTDGDFEALIPEFLEAGVDGFNPMEVAAGMEPVRMRRKYGRSFCMVGGIDKREIAKDRAAIDREVAKIAPLIQEGGYIPWIDHAIPPDISLDNFRHYLEQKKKVILGG
jgi:uroporphyrinogen decarboxylase